MYSVSINLKLFVSADLMRCRAFPWVVNAILMVLYCSRPEDANPLDVGGQRGEKRPRQQDVPMVLNAEGALDQAQAHGGDGDGIDVGVLVSAERALHEPLLPLDLIYRLILPHAFDTPSQAASFCLVCSHFREATSRLWFWTDGPWMLQLVVMRVRLTPFDDENERGSLLHVLLTMFRACDVIQAVGLKETIGALVGHSPRRRRAFREVGLQVFEVGDDDWSSGVYFGGIEKDERFGKSAMYYNSGNSFFGAFFGDMFHGPDCTFRWNCGMLFKGEIEHGLRFGPGRLELVDGSIFECNFSVMEDTLFEEQHGIFLLDHGKVKVDGSVTSGGAHWHSTREEQELSPFLIVRIGDGRSAHISDKRGVLEWCNADAFSNEPVLTANGDMAYVFHH